MYCLFTLVRVSPRLVWALWVHIWWGILFSLFPKCICVLGIPRSSLCWSVVSGRKGRMTVFEVLSVIASFTWALWLCCEDVKPCGTRQGFSTQLVLKVVKILITWVLVALLVPITTLGMQRDDPAQTHKSSVVKTWTTQFSTILNITVSYWEYNLRMQVSTVNYGKVLVSIVCFVLWFWILLGQWENAFFRTCRAVV